MTTNSQLSTTKPKKQKQTKQTIRTRTKSQKRRIHGGVHWGGLRKNGGKGIGNKKHNWLWGTIPSMGNVAQPPLGKASGERGWRAGPTSMDKFSSGKSGLHYT